MILLFFVTCEKQLLRYLAQLSVIEGQEALLAQDKLTGVISRSLLLHV